MENTPVIETAVVSKKNVLFEVTALSKILAAVVFIVLPFVGFWLGVQFAKTTPPINYSVPVSASKESADDTTKPIEQASPSQVTETKDFKGPWFKISYPEDFTPSITGLVNSQAGEMSFVSPDKSVEFFVYSPQWYGNPATYLDAQPGEEKISDESRTETVEVNPSYTDTTVTRWVTYRAIDKSYIRSVMSIKGQAFETPDKYGQDAVMHHVFGIKYKDQTAYDLYLPEYLKFKESLIQYADH